MDVLHQRILLVDSPFLNSTDFQTHFSPQEVVRVLVDFSAEIDARNWVRHGHDMLSCLKKTTCCHVCKDSKPCFDDLRAFCSLSPSLEVASRLDG